MNADEKGKETAISLDEDLVNTLSILAIRKNKTKSEVIREALNKSNMLTPLETDRDNLNELLEEILYQEKKFNAKVFLILFFVVILITVIKFSL